MNERICIVGVGSIGSRHIDNLLAMGYQDLVGVETRPMPNDERLPIVNTFEDLSWWNPTHVLICSPPEFHCRHAWRFLERGIPTFIEKPMTVRLLEAAALTELAQKNNACLAVGYMERAHPVVIEARQWAATHTVTLGEFFCYWRAAEKTYALKVTDESSHAIDTARHILGDITKAVRTGGVRVRAHIGLLHGQIRSQVTMDMDASPLRRIQLYADGGQMFSKSYGAIEEEWDACYRTELQAFLDGKPLCTGEDGAKVVQILEQVR